MHIETSAASFTSFNSEEGFGSPAAHRNKDRPNVFDMDDNDLKVQNGVTLHCTPCALWSCSVVPEMAQKYRKSSAAYCCENMQGSS